MIKNPTIAEFENAVTMRVLFDRLVDHREHYHRTRFAYRFALSQAVYAANDLLKELGINGELWCRIRGQRAYISHEKTRRIAAELGVITDEAEHGQCRRFRAALIGRSGWVKPPTIGDLAIVAGRPRDRNSGPRRNNNFRITNFRKEK
jgi:hypothetical protein